MGVSLFEAAFDLSQRLISDNEVMEKLGLVEANRDYVFRELLIIHFYCIIWVIDPLVEDELTRDNVFDSMHFAYYQMLKSKFNFIEPEIKQEHFYILSHYERFNKAKDINRGPNELWPISQIMLEHLHGKRIDSIISLHMMTILVINCINSVTEFVSQYKIEDE